MAEGVIDILHPPAEPTLIQESERDQRRESRRLGNSDPASPTKPAAEKPPLFWPKWAILEREKWNQQLAAATRRIAELEGAILMNQQENRRALSIYGSENALEEVTKLVALAPQFKGLTPEEHRFVAGVGLASGLNPVFHLHAWKQEEYNPDTKKKEETLHIVPHYTALIASCPDPIMTDERRLSVDEMRSRGIPEADIQEGAIAYEVTGTNLKHALMARQAGQPYTPKHGFGWWCPTRAVPIWKTGSDGKRYKSDEFNRVPNDVPNGRDGEWRARTRAQRDLYNQFADLRPVFAAPEGGRVREDEIIMGKGETPDADENVVYGEFVEDSTPAPAKAPWLTVKDGEGETRAREYAAEKDVTDEQISASLSVPDWRYTLITPDEYKVAVDHIALQNAPIVGVEEATADPATVSSPEPAETGHEPDSAEPVTPTPPEPPAETVTPPVETPTPVVAPVAELCTNCGMNPADPTNPIEPAWCGACASLKADRDAKKQSAK